MLLANCFLNCKKSRAMSDFSAPICMLCVRDGLAEDAKVYNDLSVSWDSIVAKANDFDQKHPRQAELDL